MTQKIYNLEYSGYIYPLTKQLILNGRKNKFFNKKNYKRLIITLFHGTKDKVVPVKFSKRLLKQFPNAKKKLVKIKNGDHSLSRQSDLKKICKELEYMI